MIAVFGIARIKPAAIVLNRQPYLVVLTFQEYTDIPCLGMAGHHSELASILDIWVVFLLASTGTLIRTIPLWLVLANLVLVAALLLLIILPLISSLPRLRSAVC
jgi:hypothetical protein